jgi:hypothetical protein
MDINKNNNENIISSNGTAQYKDALKERHKQIGDLVEEQKKQMMSVEKEKLIDIIFSQNTIITQQSNQMIDMINLVNDMDNFDSNISKNKNVIDNSVSPQELQHNINILRKRHQMCKEANDIRKKSSNLFNSSVKIQFVLFILFIIVLFWLFYHFSTFSADSE